MAQLGVVRKSRGAIDKLRAHPDACENLAKGLGYDEPNAAVKMITMSVGLLEEPTYYSETGSLKDLEHSAKINHHLQNAGFKKHNTDNLFLRSRELLSSAIAVARSKHPRDVLAIGHWLRREMNIRTTPCVLLAIAASQVKTKPFVREYCSKIICRADELRQVFAAYMHLFGRPLPNSLKRGLADAFGKFSEFDLLRYDTRNHPTFADVLLMIDRGKNRALSQPVFEYLVNRKVVNRFATPLIAARKDLAQLHYFDEQARFLARKAKATWEVLLSQFGNKREVWEFILEEKLIGYMALLRNLRNILNAHVRFDLVEKAARHIEENVTTSKQLPFRFLSAYRSITENHSVSPFRVYWGTRYRSSLSENVDSDSKDRLLEALNRAMLEACKSIPRIPGTTLIAADNSGSMQQAVSRNSLVSAADAANLLCVMAAKACERPLVWAFGTDVAEVNLRRHDDVITNMQRVECADTCGYATNGYRIFQKLREQRIKVDRVILLSDMQCWNSHYCSERELAPEYYKYRKAINKNVWLHSIDLVGYGQAVVPANATAVNLVSGFSEKILIHVLQAEGLSDGADTLPTIEYIRENF